MEKGEHLADEHHVLRYVKPSHVDRHSGSEHITASAFLCRPDEDACSVNWMERFDIPVENQCACIRAEKRIRYAPTAKLARLNVGRARAYVLNEVKDVFGEDKATLRFLYDPEDADPPRFPHPHTSHSIINGMPGLDTPEGEMIGALLRDCIPSTDIYPVIAG
jgi:hypothetical protein